MNQKPIMTITKTKISTKQKIALVIALASLGLAGLMGAGIINFSKTDTGSKSLTSSEISSKILRGPEGERILLGMSSDID